MRAELVSRPAIGPMVDPFGRHVTHLRVSVTDRCDFRCVYCMSEHMVFLPTLGVLQASAPKE
jgi:GTP 3',8-cyclase